MFWGLETFTNFYYFVISEKKQLVEQLIFFLF